MTILLLRSYRFFLIVFCLFPMGVKAQDGNGDIFVGEKLSNGLKLGVDDSMHQREWFSHERKEGYFLLSFAANKDWSAVFITFGSPSSRKDERRYKDYSGFKTLSVEMKGVVGREKIEVGIKSKEQDDDGTETKIPVTLTSEWKTYQFSLDKFKGANLKELYVVAEFVYSCPKAQTVNLRNIRYLREEATKPEMGDSPCPPSEAGELDIMTGTKLSGGFGLGVNSSKGKTDWLTKKEGEFMIMSFPSDEDWSAVFITVGPPSQRLRDGRQSRDLSAFNFLSIDMRGTVGKEEIEIGIKTSTQEDDGTETKIPVTLTSEWKTYQFPLERFAGTTPRRLYVVAEFVYTGSKPQTVFFRNIKYLMTATKDR